MGLLSRRGLLLALVLGGVAGALLWNWRRDPCRVLARRYAATYARLARCRSDADCVVDPPSVHGPRICDPVRGDPSEGRDRLVEIERSFEARACPVPELSCPDPRGARCAAGRCVAIH